MLAASLSDALISSNTADVAVQQAAVDVCRRGLAVVPSSRVLWLNAGLAHAHAGDWSAGEIALTTVVGLDAPGCSEFVPTHPSSPPHLDDLVTLTRLPHTPALIGAQYMCEACMLPPVSCARLFCARVWARYAAEALLELGNIAYKSGSTQQAVDTYK